MAKQTNTHNKKQLQNNSDNWVVTKVLTAFVLLILSLVALHRIGQYYVTSEGFDVVYPGSLRWFWILVPLAVLGVAVPFFWKKPLVRELGSYVAVLSALGAVSAILFRLHWTDDLHFLYFLHALVYCLYMRDFGSVQSPQSAFLLNLGLESLHVRMARHCENGQAVAEFLSRHPKVSAVHYCGLPDDPYHALAEKYLPHGSCGVVSFELTGGRPAAEQLMGALKLAAIETHVADARTCCLNPASTTHRQMSGEQLAAAGVPAGLVRYSCGLEDKRDLIADLSQALDQIQ